MGVSYYIRGAIVNHIINQELINQIQISYETVPLSVFLIGTNGCGKSSLRNYLNLSDIQTNIDPDMLNRLYKSKYPANYQTLAAKQALKMYAEALHNEFNLCLESTLAGKGTMQRIIEAKKKGHYTVGYFIGLNSVELNIERIANRVAGGGHFIPDEIVRRRYSESVSNLIQIKDQFNLLHVIDNSEQFYRLQFTYENHQIHKPNQQRLAAWALDLVARFSFR